jgi:hypothetical protein
MGLTKTTHAVVKLCVRSGFSPKETARILGLPLRTVKDCLGA